VNKWYVGTPEQEAKKQRKKRSKSFAPRFQDLSEGLPDDDEIQVDGIDAQDPGDGPDEEIDKAETDTPVVAAANGGSDDISTMIEEEEEEVVRPAKKQKVAAVEIAAYVDITPPSRNPKVKEVTVTCGPFLFTVETTHDAFLQGIVSCAMSKGQSHSITSVNQSQLYWKFNIPLNDKKKPLSTVVGYQALISSMKTRLQDAKGKSKDNGITLTMPPLSKKVSKASCYFSGNVSDHL